MAIIKTPKNKNELPKLLSKTEKPLAKIIRVRKEKEAKEIKDLKDKELARIAEENRMEKLIIPYLDNLQKQIIEKDLLEFWTFTDEPGFKKIKGILFHDMQNFLNKDVEKYKNRKVALISFSFHHHDSKTTIHRKAGSYLGVSMTIFPIDKNGILNGDDNAWGADIVWKSEDFKTTKFSFKLLETILKPVGKRKKIFTSLLGFTVTFVIKELKKIKVNFDNVLKPLPGA